ncbi:MAG TPA: DUF4350 domain-containing protein [Anaerolineae bacterium]|nr:DUF4350 domain-containing protein [Anaerolineae bacterium]
MTRGRQILLVVLLIALPVALQSLWFYRGRYTPPSVPGLDEVQITLATPEYRFVPGEPKESTARVVIDLSHANNLEVDDLSPLRDRLAALGATVLTFEGPSDALAAELRRASAWIAIAPTTAYSPEQRDTIAAFVADGGRLLIAADPTRSVPPLEEDAFDPFGLFSRISAVPAANSLAGAFGIVYFDDYLYNLVENEGNYRNVKFNEFGDHALTKDLRTVTLFATHSLRTNGRALVVGDADTRSPLRSGESDLAAAVLGAGERVLALGDVSLFSAPYHTLADNDRFLSNIANWLAEDKRDWSIAEFPYLFKGPVDLVQANGGNLDPRLIARSAELQAAFQKAGLPLSLRAEAAPDRDTLFVGTFDDLEAVQEFLVTAGVTVTLPAEDETDSGEPAPLETGSASSTPESVETGTPTSTPFAEEEEAASQAEPFATRQVSGTITIEGIGVVPVAGTTLYVSDDSGGRAVVVTLAEDAEGAIKALDRLESNDFGNCVHGGAVTVCSTGEGEEGSGLGSAGAQAPGDAQKPGEGQGSRILILVRDIGRTGARTSEQELESMLTEAAYSVKVWSMRRDGTPASSDTTGYDAIIVDSGDYAFDSGDIESLATLTSLRGRVLFIGAQPVPVPEGETALISDLVVVDAGHPIAKGFEQDQVIPLNPSESGVPALVIQPEALDSAGAEVAVIFERGPESEEAGARALVAGTGGVGDTVERAIVAAFALYQLPEDMQRMLVLNAVGWLLAE